MKKIVVLIVTIILVLSLGALAGNYSMPQPGDTGLGTGNLSTSRLIDPVVDVRNYNSLADAVSGIGIETKTLMITSSATVTTKVVIPPTLSVIITNTGSITKSGAGALAINGPFSAGLYQVFSGLNAGDVTFGVGAVKEVYLQWWGTTWHASLSAASASLPRGGIVSFPSGTYTFTGQAVLQSNIRYIGSGDSTVLQVGNATTNIFSNYNANYLLRPHLTNLSFDHLSFDGNYSAFSDPRNDNYAFGIYLLEGDGVHIDHCSFKNFWYDAVAVFGTRDFWVSENTFNHCGDKNTYLGYYRAISFDGGANNDGIYNGGRGWIYKNKIYNSGTGIGSTGASATNQDYEISENIIDTTKTTGIYVLDGARNRLNIHHNHLISTGDAAIYISSGNTITNHPNFMPVYVVLERNIIESPARINASADVISVVAKRAEITSNSIIGSLSANQRAISLTGAYDFNGSLVYPDSSRITMNDIISSATITSLEAIRVNAHRTLVQGNTIKGLYSVAAVNIAFGTANRVIDNYLPVNIPLIDRGYATAVRDNKLSDDAMTGSFTLSAASSFTISNHNILPNNVNRIVIYPVSAPTATSQSLFLYSTVPYTSFTLHTGSGSNAAGTEKFYYEIH